jgi:DNA-binding winged helix-turn-helix (wHTH) protein
VASVRGAAAQEKSGQSVQLSLTLRAFRVLRHMSQSPRRVFTRSELIDTCLPGGGALERTVDNHVRNLRKKLEKAGATEMITVVRGVGYKLTGFSRYAKFAGIDVFDEGKTRSEQACPDRETALESKSPQREPRLEKPPRLECFTHPIYLKSTRSAQET